MMIVIYDHDFYCDDGDNIGDYIIIMIMMIYMIAVKKIVVLSSSSSSSSPSSYSLTSLSTRLFESIPVIEDYNM